MSNPQGNKSSKGVDCFEEENVPFAIAAMDARKQLASWLDFLHLASYIVTSIVDILSTLKNAFLRKCKNLHATDVRTSNP